MVVCQLQVHDCLSKTSATAVTLYQFVQFLMLSIFRWQNVFQRKKEIFQNDEGRRRGADGENGDEGQSGVSGQVKGNREDLSKSRLQTLKW